MKTDRIMALVRKEIVEGLRSGWLNIPATAAVSVMLLLAPLSRSGLTPAAAALLQARIAIFLPLLAMPFFAGTMLSRAIQTERLRGGLLPLLVYGGSPAEVWLSKVLGAFALSYGVMLLSLGGYIGYGRWHGRDLLPALSALPYVFVVMPIAALSLIAAQALLFWVMGRSALVSVILPLVILFGGAQLVAFLGLGPVSAKAGGAAVLVSAIVVAVLAMAVHAYPRERAAGLVGR